MDLCVLIELYQRLVVVENMDNIYTIRYRDRSVTHYVQIFMQYFARLTHTQELSGKRVIYAEAIDEEQAMTLLATHIIDFSVGGNYHHITLC